MDNKPPGKKILIENGYDYDDLEMEPPSDQLFVRTGEEGDDLVPVNGWVYELSEQDGSVLNYGEYADGLPHGISVDFHPNGQVKQIYTHFHGPIHGEQRQWDREGRLVFRGEYEYGHELRYQKWDESGNLIEEKAEPDESQLTMIGQSREFYQRHYGARMREFTPEEVLAQGVPWDELVEEYMEDVVLRPGGDSPFTGLAYELSENGERLLSYGEYTDGLPHGTSVFYYSNGQIKSRDTIFHGSGHGWSRKWDEQGDLIFLGEYIHGISVRFREWSGCGQLIDEKTEPDLTEKAIIDQRIRDNQVRWPEEAAGLTCDFLENRGWPKE